jgi:Zn-dependent peptidase ImmA (M78 family)
MFKKGFKPHDPIEPNSLIKYLGIITTSPNNIPDLSSEDLKVLLEDESSSWSAVTLTINDKKVIILNSAHTGGRPASDLMHEVAHIIIGHKPSHIHVTEDKLLIVSTYNKEQEEEAEWMAGCLLLPRQALVHLKSRSISNITIQERYGVSGQMLGYRLNVTGVNYQFRRMSNQVTNS